MLIKEYTSFIQDMAAIVGELYGMIEKEPSAGVFSLRVGQMFNMILYRIGNPRLSVRIYRVLAHRKK